jgi:hypothetical protein
LVAESVIHEPFAVINADDYYGVDAFKKMADYLSGLSVTSNAFAMVGFDLLNTLSEFGSVSRGICEVNAEGLLTKVVERTRISKDNKGIAYFDSNDQPVYVDDYAITSMNFWGFTPLFFEHLKVHFANFLRENIQNLKSEFYLPTIVDILIHTNEATLKVLRSQDRWFGVTYANDKPIVVARIAELVEKGIYPSNLWKV